MDYQAIFKRYETKFLLTLDEEAELIRLMDCFMLPDEFPSSLICNLYYDTPSYLLIRRSLEKPLYKEKLRIRSYGTARHDSRVFAEIKKKYDSVVYKRRLCLTEGEATDCFLGKRAFPDTQIGRELAFCRERYPSLAPRVFLSYERRAYRGKNDGGFRMTLDKNILWRSEELSLTKGAYGNKILDDGYSLLEVKSAFGIPPWLNAFFAENGIIKCSFSKYGKAYEEMLKSKLTAKAN